MKYFKLIQEVLSFPQLEEDEPILLNLHKKIQGLNLCSIIQKHDDVNDFMKGLGFDGFFFLTIDHFDSMSAKNKLEFFNKRRSLENALRELDSKIQYDKEKNEIISAEIVGSDECEAVNTNPLGFLTLKWAIINVYIIIHPMINCMNYFNSNFASGSIHLSYPILDSLIKQTNKKSDQEHKEGTKGREYSIEHGEKVQLYTRWVNEELEYFDKK